MTETLTPARPGCLWPPMPKRRLHPRYPAPGLRAYLVREQLEYILPVRLLNVSAAGLQLRLGNRPRLGTELTIRLYNPVNNWTCVRGMAVVYAMMQDDGGFLAGAAFTEELDEAELKLLLGDPLPDVPADLEDTPPTPAQRVSGFGDTPARVADHGGLGSWAAWADVPVGHHLGHFALRRGRDARAVLP